MKKIIIAIAGLFLFIGGHAQSQSKTVDVLYFHKTVRCKTCNEIEKIVEEMVAKDYKKEKAKGTLNFISIDFQKSDDSLIKKHKVSGPALLIVCKNKGKEQVFDLTADGFKYALSNPAELRKIISSKINEGFR